MLQRQVATHLEIDTPMLSKIEREARNAKREHVTAGEFTFTKVGAGGFGEIE